MKVFWTATPSITRKFPPSAAYSITVKLPDPNNTHVAFEHASKSYTLKQIFSSFYKEKKKEAHAGGKDLQNLHQIGYV